MQNGRCRMHGGKSLSGRRSPRRTHGLYARSPAERFAALVQVLAAAGYTTRTPADAAVVRRLSLWFGPRRLWKMFGPALALGFAQGGWKARCALELACFVSPYDPEEEAWLSRAAEALLAECARRPET